MTTLPERLRTLADECLGVKAWTLKSSTRQEWGNALREAADALERAPPRSAGWSEAIEAAAKVADRDANEAREALRKYGTSESSASFYSTTASTATRIASAIRYLPPPDGSADGWCLPPEFGERVAIIKAWDGWPYHLYCADYSRRWPDPVLVEKAYAASHKCAACRQPLLPSPPASE